MNKQTNFFNDRKELVRNTAQIKFTPAALQVMIEYIKYFELTAAYKQLSKDEKQKVLLAKYKMNKEWNETKKPNHKSGESGVKVAIIEFPIPEIEMLIKVLETVKASKIYESTNQAIRNMIDRYIGIFKQEVQNHK